MAIFSMYPLQHYVFDLLWMNGQQLTGSYVNMQSIMGWLLQNGFPYTYLFQLYYEKFI